MYAKDVPPPRKSVAVVAVCLTGLAALAALHFAEPLAGDQSLFALGAREMTRGAVLYRDFWDLKQPGIFDFFYIARVLGGNDPIAVHVLEALVLVLLAGVATFAFGRSRSFTASAPYSAVAGLALYLAVAEAHQQLQVESLANVPLFLFAWLLCEGLRAASPRSRIGWYLGAGVAAGAALALKILFLPLVCAMFIAAVAIPDVADAGRPRSRQMLVAMGWLAAGAALAATIVILPIALGGAVPLALKTWFEYPSRIAATMPHQQTSVLVYGIKWFIRSFACAIVFGAIGFAMLVRRRNLDALARALATWIVLGIATILVQKTSWWDYQWMMLAVPLGAFAGAGFAAAWGAATRLQRIGLALAALVLCVGPLRAVEHRAISLARHRFAFDASERERYREEESTEFAATKRDALALPPGASVYVFGTPVYYIAAEREQAIPLNGWSSDLLVAEQRDELLHEFQTIRPKYVYITNDDPGHGVLFARSPAFARYFAQHYGEARRSDFAVLYGPVR